MRPLHRLALFSLAVLLVSCQNPRVQANVAEAMIQFGSDLAEAKQDLSAMQFQIDSLKQVAARQDTMITRLAALAGIPVLR